MTGPGAGRGGAPGTSHARGRGLGAFLRRLVGRRHPPPDEPPAGLFTARSLSSSPPSSPQRGTGTDARPAAERDPPTPPVEPLFGDPAGDAAAEATEEAAVEQAAAAGDAATVPGGEQLPRATAPVRVHDDRLEARSAPMELSPSEAVALAAEGPEALHRRRRREAE